MQMRLTYLFHSGFSLETDTCLLVFDYWMDPARVMPRLLESGKPLYVLASHFHAWPAIFTKTISRPGFSPGRNSGRISLISCPRIS